MSALRLDRDHARRLAVRAQRLDAVRPDDLVDTVDRLTLLQIDPTAAIAPSADLVAYGRLGADYAPRDLTEALEVERALVELRGYVRPRADLPALIPLRDGFNGHPSVAAWLEANDEFRTDVLVRLEEAGPLLSRDIPDTSAVPWRSSGWTGNRNVTQMLEFCSISGDVAVTGRKGRQRLWDLGERVYGSFTPLPRVEADRLVLERRLRSLGLARDRGPSVPGEQVTVGDAGVAVEVDGVEGSWRADESVLADLEERPFVGRTALLSPFDRLIHDRDRMEQLFGFEYVLEMYKPAAARRWGYFALPVLHHDRLVGKLDAKADRKAGVLWVHDVHEDGRWTRAMRLDVDEAIDDLGAWLELEVRR